jgi:hypothetical protein
MSEDVEGRTRVQLSVAGSGELRPDIFRLATEQRWVLWELHRGQASLEQLFREITEDAEPDLAETGGHEALDDSVPDLREGESEEVMS